MIPPLNFKNIPEAYIVALTALVPAYQTILRKTCTTPAIEGILKYAVAQASIMGPLLLAPNAIAYAIDKTTCLRALASIIPIQFFQTRNDECVNRVLLGSIQFFWCHLNHNIPYGEYFIPNVDVASSTQRTRPVAQSQRSLLAAQNIRKRARDHVESESDSDVNKDKAPKKKHKEAPVQPRLSAVANITSIERASKASDRPESTQAKTNGSKHLNTKGQADTLIKAKPITSVSKAPVEHSPKQRAHPAEKSDKKNMDGVPKANRQAAASTRIDTATSASKSVLEKPFIIPDPMDSWKPPVRRVEPRKPTVITTPPSYDAKAHIASIMAEHEAEFVREAEAFEKESNLKLGNAGKMPNSIDLPQSVSSAGHLSESLAVRKPLLIH